MRIGKNGQKRSYRMGQNCPREKVAELFELIQDSYGLFLVLEMMIRPVQRLPSLSLLLNDLLKHTK